MKEKEVIIKKNKYYESAKPKVSICTPIYNRLNTIDRPLNSVRKQDYKNFEYIIVDDGSTDGVSEVITKYMDEVDFPVIFVRKSNGGVHTARNLAVKLARGKYFCNIDSDDELLPNALSTFLKAWDLIPKDKVDEYREVVALCEDENHNIFGSLFPSDINSFDKETASKMCEATGGDHISLELTKIRKENLFPEPKGVKFVSEGVLWRKLDTIYRAYYINEPLRIYYREGGDDHLSNVKKKNMQYVINMLYNSQVFLNDTKIYIHSFKEKIITVMKYLIFKNIVKRQKVEISFDYSLKTASIDIKFLIIIFYLPCLFGASLYTKKKLTDVK